MTTPLHTVLVTAPALHPAGVRVLELGGCAIRYISAAGGVEELASVLRRDAIDGIVSRTLPLDASMIDAARTLRVISRHGIGYNNVDVNAATRRRIPLMLTGSTNAQSVAELAIGLMLAVARSIPAHDSAIRAGRWERTSSGVQVSGATLGLVGYGSIGRATARGARGLGMKVVAFDPLATPGASEGGDVLLPTLEALLECSDVLSLHCPLTQQTKGMFGKEQLQRLRRGAIIVNTARGELIDEIALAAALRDGHVAGAGLDTLAEEPLSPGHPFRHLPNVVMTPHMGGSTDAALALTATRAAAHALSILRGEAVDLALCVNPSVLTNRGKATDV